jgi:uncharacterized protein (UPF0332 family)
MPAATARTTVEQNMVLRWVPHGQIINLYKELAGNRPGRAGGGNDRGCRRLPGNGHVQAGHRQFARPGRRIAPSAGGAERVDGQAIGNLRIKVSGCFNSCGQHHVADLGFYGNSRNINGYTVPHFQVMLGGQWTENAGSYALAMGSVPSKRIPDLVSTLTQRYAKERQGTESFQAFCQRIGKKELKTIVDQFTAVPPHAEDARSTATGAIRASSPSATWASANAPAKSSRMAQFGFTQAESEAFEAQLLLDAGQYQAADEKAYQAMLTAARTLVQLQWLDVPADAGCHRARIPHAVCGTKLFWDTYHHDQFSRYLFQRHEGADTRYTTDTAHKLVEEANLFIDAAHKCHAKVSSGRDERWREFDGGSLRRKQARFCTQVLDLAEGSAREQILARTHAKVQDRARKAPERSDRRNRSTDCDPGSHRYQCQKGHDLIFHHSSFIIHHLIPMDSSKIEIKLFVAKDVFEPAEFVPVFQRWIQTQALAGHLLIDVADYAHVPAGPGTVLVSSEANLYTDRGANRLGLLYSRKLPLAGTFAQRLRAVFAETVKAAAMLEDEPTLKGRLNFLSDQWLLRINDRLLAPNTAETFHAVRGDLQQFTTALYGRAAELAHTPSALTLFEVRVQGGQAAPVRNLLDRLR